jgi:hypothetical protein
MKITQKALLILIVFLLPQILLAQTGTVGRIEILADGQDQGILINVYDVSVTDMKNREIHMGFMLAQNGEWLEDSWVSVEPFIVEYDPCYWNGHAFWFSYKYELLDEIGDADRPLWDSFFIIDTLTDEIIARKDKEFSINELYNTERSYAYMEQDILGDYKLEINGDYYRQGYNDKIRLLSLDDNTITGEVWLDWNIGAEARMPEDWEILHKLPFSCQIAGNSLNFSVQISMMPVPESYEFNLNINTEGSNPILMGDLFIVPMMKSADENKVCRVRTVME